MSQVKISAHKKVGALAFDHQGDLVVLADGAVISASAWEAAQKLDALAPHFAKGRITAAACPDAPKPAAEQPAPSPSGKSRAPKGADKD